MQLSTTYGVKRSLFGLKRLAGSFCSSLAQGNKYLPSSQGSQPVRFSLLYISSTFLKKKLCWPQHCTFLDQFHGDFNINNLQFVFQINWY